MIIFVVDYCFGLHDITIYDVFNVCKWMLRSFIFVLVKLCADVSIRTEVIEIKLQKICSAWRVFCGGLLPWIT